MIKQKTYIEIEDHVTKLKIKGWETTKNINKERICLNIKGIADGKKFEINTTGKMLVSEIIDAIVNEVKK